MSRHTVPERIPSGIVFSRPATASKDIWPGTRRAPATKAIPSKCPRSKERNTTLGRRGELLATAGHDGVVDSEVSPFALYATTSEAFERTLGDVVVSHSATKETGTDQDHTAPYCLPVLSVDLKITVDGTLACGELTQTFRNPSDIEIHEARHIFPLYDGAAVTAFECVIGNERRLQGVVKPKQKAQQVYREAVENTRKTAALLEEYTPDMFESALGNIPPQTDVKVRLTYLHELKAVLMAQESAEGIAVVVPTSIAPRYGTQLPPEMLQSTYLQIETRVVDDGTINDRGYHVESGHQVKYQGRKPMQETVVMSDPTKLPREPHPPSGSKMQFVWQYESQKAVLGRDFILVLQRREGYPLQSRALLAPPNSEGQAAMMVSLRPTDLFTKTVRPLSFTGEIIFLLDQSASMGWTSSGPDEAKLRNMRQAMSLALSSLPSSCAFNIIRFGTGSIGLWHKSRPHSAEDIEVARAYVSNARADLGGTDLLLALQDALGHRDQQRPSTQIVMVTDGELDPAPIAEYIWLIRKQLQNRVRFFALGIGDIVSHGLIECVAEFGGGLGDVVDVATSSRWEARLNRLVRSALEPDSWNCEISLGPDFSRQSLQCVTWGQSESPTSLPVSYIQAPFTTPALHPFVYRSIYFLIDARNNEPPTEVIIRAMNSGARSNSHRLPVQLIHTNSGFVHRLAVKACLLSLEHEVKHDATNLELARINAEHLGQGYSITSQWTSFVATPQDSQHDEPLAESALYQPKLKTVGIEEALRRLEIDLDDTELSRPPTPNSDSGLPDSDDPHIVFDPSPKDQAEDPYQAAVSRTLREYVSRDESEYTGSTVGGDDEAVKVEDSEPYNTPKSRKVRSCPSPDEDATSDLDEENEGSVDAADDGSITWQDAVTDTMANGTFRLLDAIRDRLGQHYCTSTTDKLWAMFLTFPGGGALPQEILHDMIDTIMMIQYFRTHKANEEDVWGLMMSRAESALLATLKLSDEEEDRLDPLYEMLRVSIMHRHWEILQLRQPMHLVDDPIAKIDSGIRCHACDGVFTSDAKVDSLVCPYNEEGVGDC
ncbi:hypothetical protein ASPCADRAFT_127342 [Aspergillus carbonarius ITEM 5010]|uniref:VIT domain-containing protein n=1 Tax=Aspergillus carbonarius (strain ITEM 5010) TaxID=602072 RepID=A0A1R3RW93_ASPC5|nr:hypothetical protein ASPCADRAFT_127342 [Aspergillus carbonarius ITEM 5010]